MLFGQKRVSVGLQLASVVCKWATLYGGVIEETCGPTDVRGQQERGGKWNGIQVIAED